MEAPDEPSAPIGAVYEEGPQYVPIHHTLKRRIEEQGEADNFDSAYYAEINEHTDKITFGPAAGYTAPKARKANFPGKSDDGDDLPVAEVIQVAEPNPNVAIIDALINGPSIAKIEKNLEDDDWYSDDDISFFSEASDTGNFTEDDEKEENGKDEREEKEDL